MPSFRSRKDGTHYPIFDHNPRAKVSSSTRSDPWGKRRSSISLQQANSNKRAELEKAVMEVSTNDDIALLLAIDDAGGYNVRDAPEETLRDLVRLKKFGIVIDDKPSPFWFLTRKGRTVLRMVNKP